MEALHRRASFKITKFAELATLIHAIDFGDDHFQHNTAPEIRRELATACADMSDTRCGAFAANGYRLELSETAINVLDDALEVWAQSFEGEDYASGQALEEAKVVWQLVDDLRTALKASGLLEQSGAPTVGECRHPVVDGDGICSRCSRSVVVKAVAP